MASASFRASASMMDVFHHVCVVLRSNNSIALEAHPLKPPAPLVQSIKDAIKEMSGKSDIKVTTDTEFTYLTLPPKLPLQAFLPRMLEEMIALGYDYVHSASLSNQSYYGALFFAKNMDEGSNRTKQPVIALSLNGGSCLDVYNCTMGIVNLIQNSMTFGMKKQDWVKIKGGEYYHFEMVGEPWKEGQYGKLGACNLILDIIGKLGKSHWRLFGSTTFGNMLFFTYEEEYNLLPTDLALLAAADKDKLQVVTASPETHNIASVIDKAVKSQPDLRLKNPNREIQPNVKFHEFSFTGSPFNSQKEASMEARKLICSLFDVLSKAGWEVLQPVHVFDKSMFVMRNVEPEVEASSEDHKFACLAMSSRKRLTFLGFPPQVQEILRTCVAKEYLPGVQKEFTSPMDYSLTLKLDKLTAKTSHGEINYSKQALVMLMAFLEEAARTGWQLKATGNVCARQMGRKECMLEAHSWIFCQKLETPRQEEDIRKETPAQVQMDHGNEEQLMPAKIYPTEML